VNAIKHLLAYVLRWRRRAGRRNPGSAGTVGSSGPV